MSFSYKQLTNRGCGELQLELRAEAQLVRSNLGIRENNIKSKRSKVKGQTSSVRGGLVHRGGKTDQIRAPNFIFRNTFRLLRNNYTWLFCG